MNAKGSFAVVISIGISLGSTWNADAVPFRNLVANTANKTDSAPIVIRDKWALLVGVDSFQDPAVPPNKGSAKNVADLAATLKDPTAGRFTPDHVVVLTGDKATKSGIEQAISGWLLKKALPDDLVLLYISSASISGPNGEPMVFSYDTLGSEPQLSGLDMKALATDLKRRIQSKNIVMVVDASPAANPAPDFTGLSNLGISVITATSGNQKSINNGTLGVSLFENHLAEGVRHAGGALTLQQIFDHVASTVSADATNCFKATQTPVLALAGNNPQAGSIPLGVAVKSSTKPSSVSFGHPLDNLALSRPDLIAPRNAHAPVKAAPPAAAKPAPVASAAAPKPVAKPAAVDEEDDDDDEKAAQHVDFGSYMTKMKADIQKAWKPPKGLESRRISAVFTIMRDGRIINPQIVEGSGVPEVDKSALDALAAASPLDPLPPGSPRSVDIKYKFDWNVRRE